MYIFNYNKIYLENTKILPKILIFYREIAKNTTFIIPLFIFTLRRIFMFTTYFIYFETHNKIFYKHDYIKKI